MRRMAKWQTRLDDRLIESLADAEWPLPTEQVAAAVGEPAGRVRDRLFTLTHAEFTSIAYRTQRGIKWELGDDGQGYLDGRMDALGRDRWIPATYLKV